MTNILQVAIASPWQRSFMHDEQPHSSQGNTIHIAYNNRQNMADLEESNINRKKNPAYILWVCGHVACTNKLM